MFFYLFIVWVLVCMFITFYLCVCFGVLASFVLRAACELHGRQKKSCHTGAANCTIITVYYQDAIYYTVMYRTPLINLLKMFRL